MALDGGRMYWHVWHIELMKLPTVLGAVNGFSGQRENAAGKGDQSPDAPPFLISSHSASISAALSCESPRCEAAARASTFLKR